MKRLPLLYSLLAMIALSASIAYWAMLLFKPAQRPLAAAPAASLAEPSAEAGATLFGGQAAVAVVSNYQLTGVVAAGREGVAILVADGQPPMALKVGKEVAGGVTVKEVHPRYVMLSEGGVLKRIELATDAKAGPDMAPPVSARPGDQRSLPRMTPTPLPQPETTQEQPASMPQGVPPPPPNQMPAPTRVIATPGDEPPTQ